MTCHTGVAGRTLGPEVAQLNRTFTYPRGVTSNQLETLEGLGYFSAPLGGPVASLARLEPPFGGGPLELRARAYLHANCSNCHRQGAVQGPHDLRYSLTFMQTNTCNVTPTAGNLGIPGALILAPTNPALSLLSVRMHALDSSRMPPLGTAIVDTVGSALVDQWITSVTMCP